MLDVVVREARIAGVRRADLETVERRRIQLWMLTAGLLIAVSATIALTTMWPAIGREALLPTGVLEGSMVALSIGFSAYVFEKERSLRRLTRLLIDERVMREHLTRQVRRLDSLVEAGRSLSASLELSRVVELSLDAALGLVNSGSGAIMLVGKDGLRLEAATGEDPVVFARRDAVEVAATGEPRLLRAPGEDGAHGMSVPLRQQGRVVGVLNVFAGDDAPFSDLDLDTMTAFADHAAAAIANAVLFEEERANSARLQELEMVRSEFAWLAR